MENLLQPNIRIIVVGLLLSMSLNTVSAVTYTSTQNGSWSDASTWGGVGPPSATGAGGDVFIINHTVTRSFTNGFGARIFTINNGGTLHNIGKLNFGFGGEITINLGGTISSNDEIVINTGGGGAPTNVINGTLSANTITINSSKTIGTPTITATDFIIEGSAQFNITGGSITTTDEIIVKGSGTSTIGAEITAGTSFTVQNGVNLTVTGDIMVGTDFNIFGSNAVILTSGTIDIGGGLNGGSGSANLTINGSLTATDISLGGTTTLKGTGDFTYNTYNQANGTGVTCGGVKPVIPTPLAGPASYDLATCAGGLLPVIFSYFDVSCSNGDIQLIWETSKEKNNSHFNIEGSVDATSFQKVGEVIGSGTTYKPTVYSYILETQSDYKYYRLKQVDYDREFDHSNVVSATCKVLSDIILFPTVSLNALFTLRVINPEEILYIDLYSIQGKKVHSQVIEYPVVNNKLSFQGLASGAYIARVRSNSGLITAKIIIE